MVVYFISKTQADKFVEQGLFKVGDKSTYTNMWHDTNPFEKSYFNCQQFRHRSEGSTRPKVCGNYAVLGHTYIQCDNSISMCANYQGKN